MSRLASPRAVIAGSALVLAVNALFLGSAAWNRRGEPAERMVLTERELGLPSFRVEENNEFFLTLQLGHKIPPPVRMAAILARRQVPPPARCAWLDREKLLALGFGTDLARLESPARDADFLAPQRRAWIALEFAGPAWEDWLAGEEDKVRRLRSMVETGGAGAGQLEEAEALLAIDRAQRSRLWAVDASLDPAVLEARYPDRGRYWVLEGLVVIRAAREGEASPAVQGTVAAVFPEEIHVPARFKEKLAPLLPRESWAEKSSRWKSSDPVWPEPQAPRFTAALALGRRHEPWLTAVERIPGAQPGN